MPWPPAPLCLSFPLSSIGSQRALLPAWFPKCLRSLAGRRPAWTMPWDLFIPENATNALLQRSALTERVPSEGGKAGLEADERCYGKRLK